MVIMGCGEDGAEMGIKGWLHGGLDHPQRMAFKWGKLLGEPHTFMPLKIYCRAFRFGFSQIGIDTSMTLLKLHPQNLKPSKLKIWPNCLKAVATGYTLIMLGYSVSWSKECHVSRFTSCCVPASQNWFITWFNSKDWITWRFRASPGIGVKHMYKHLNNYRYVQHSLEDGSSSPWFWWSLQDRSDSKWARLQLKGTLVNPSINHALCHDLFFE